jgi:hypothetical protein
MSRTLSRLRLPALALVAVVVLLVAGRAGAGEDSSPARAEAEARVAELAKAGPAADAVAAYKLALDLEAKGYRDLAAKAYEIVVGLEPEHLAARRALGYERVGGAWFQGDDLQRAKGFVRHEARWMTSEEFAAATRPQREAAEQKAGEDKVRVELTRIASQDPDLVLRATRALGGMEARFKLAPLAEALRCEPPALRVFAAEELARLDDPLAAPALLKRAIYDPDAKARQAMALALKQLALPSTVAPLARALASQHSDTRVRAAEALGLLGDQAAMGVVIARWEARSGNFPNVYFAQVKQISYIQDFDVEVAQTSFIADPIVGVLQEGVVQSFRILATEQTFYTVERLAYHDALQNLAGTDLGDNAKAWAGFWHENKDRLRRESDERYAAAARERAAARK